VPPRREVLSLVLLLAGASAGPGAAYSQAPQLERAFVFGRDGAGCAGGGAPGHPGYELVDIAAGDADLVEYDAIRGWGYEPIFAGNGDRNGFARFGPMEPDPGPRDAFDGACPDSIYESFAGFHEFAFDCDEDDVPAPDAPCPVPEGGIFRVDVPNGFYRFVAAAGDPEKARAHRLVVENGGNGPPGNLSPDHAVLIANFDQAQFPPGTLAAVGFDEHLPPRGDGAGRDPLFVAFDADGRATPCAPRSQVLAVTRGYVRVHQVRGSSRNGARAPDRDGGGALSLLEIWRVASPDLPPNRSPVVER
jgi:hypothetical protein